MFKNAIKIFIFAVIMLYTLPAWSFVTYEDGIACRAYLNQFNHEMALANQMLIRADRSNYPKSGFLSHIDVVNKQEWVRAYSANGSDAFYNLPKNTVKLDCAKLEASLTNNAYWIAEYVNSKR